MTNESRAPGCPVCGAAVEAYEYKPGYQLEVRDPLGGKDWLVGTGDEIYDSPRARMADVLAMPKPNHTFTKVSLDPCGHVLESREATAFLTAAGRFRMDQERKAAEKALEADRDVLEAAEARGHHDLVQRYRQAVYAGHREAAGLRVALATLAG